MDFVPNTNDRYTITKNGIVLDLTKNRTLKVGKIQGKVSIVDELGIRQLLVLTRLLWETFNGPIPENHIIKNINDDNELHIDNLICIPGYLVKKNLSFKSLDGFKPIIHYEDRYLIAEDAQIFSIVSNKFLKNKYVIGQNSDYISVGLTDSIKQTRYYLHRLVYCTYNNLPLNSDIIIDHIDQDKLNNNLSNLRVLTASDNSKNCVKKSSKTHNPIMQYDKDYNFIAEHHSLIDTIKKVLNMGILCKNGFLWIQEQVTDIDIDENYVCVKVDGEYYPNYKVNKNGDIINRYNRKIKFAERVGYYGINLYKNNKQCIKFVHRVVYESFNPQIDLSKETIINHKDENKLNNNLENLEVVTQKQNITYSCGKKVAQLSDDGQIIKIFNSINEACQHFKKNAVSSISKVCNGNGKNKTAIGYGWKFV